ncbi:MAG: hypothetical protein COU29_02575 [Candidatus Magasanikbacteria bacterium CG10_big_fil_rev_8_21_14_0_10_36_32]|uniref:Uncharacterized protein n=1 Tax=Candidatus Magasanikbacteria bacterium CG10_big_fil_rev_8_21_14_0_10_36_32 TaxID=1974646 RepID=A0A2M6W7C0_9BACT|nr:MAG: hypothetical protein COU29_02575 [Candidatus Magasanikbacteria bacterium CG10_big_fil_rev_8_21_14_0_10_36_32]
MKNISKTKFILTVISILTITGTILAFVPDFASSANLSTEMEAQLKSAAESGAGYGAPTDPRTTASVIIRSLLGVVGIVMVCLMIYAGFIWMTAAGNEDKVATAKKIIASAAIGFIIVLTAYSITWFLTYTAFGGRSTQFPQDTSEDPWGSTD